MKLLILFVALLEVSTQGFTHLEDTGNQMWFYRDSSSSSGEALGIWKIPFPFKNVHRFEIKVHGCPCAHQDIARNLLVRFYSHGGQTQCRRMIAQDSSVLEGVYHAECNVTTFQEATIIISLKNNIPLSQFSITSVTIFSGRQTIKYRIIRFQPDFFIHVPPRPLSNVQVTLTLNQLLLLFHAPVQVVKVILPSTAHSVNGFFYIKTYTDLNSGNTFDCILKIKTDNPPKDGLVLWGLRPITKILISAKLSPHDKVIIIYNVGGLLFEAIIELPAPTTTQSPTTHQAPTAHTATPHFTTPHFTTPPQSTCGIVTKPMPPSASFTLLTLNYQGINVMSINSHHPMRVTELLVVKKEGVIGSDYFRVFLYPHSFNQDSLTLLVRNYVANSHSITGSSCGLLSGDAHKSTYKCHESSQISSIVVLFDFESYLKGHPSHSTSDHTTSFVFSIFDARHSTLVTVEYQIKHTQVLLHDHNPHQYNTETHQSGAQFPGGNYIQVQDPTGHEYIDGGGSTGELSIHGDTVDKLGGVSDYSYMHDSHAKGRIVRA